MVVVKEAVAICITEVQFIVYQLWKNCFSIINSVEATSKNSSFIWKRSIDEELAAWGRISTGPTEALNISHRLRSVRSIMIVRHSTQIPGRVTVKLATCICFKCCDLVYAMKVGKINQICRQASCQVREGFMNWAEMRQPKPISDMSEGKNNY